MNTHFCLERTTFKKRFRPSRLEERGQVAEGVEEAAEGVEEEDPEGEVGKELVQIATR
jgi:hypothetical protein